jgi:cytosine/adenosine deaminase-related metal-dependent hydrolase
MQLKNVHTRDSTGPQQINISGGTITSVEQNDSLFSESTILFDDVIAFPGLINSHDHLDFNLFPQLANRIYNNYTEWANDIHVTNNAAIEAVQKIPKALRVQWGIYKNLINGVTTVIDHGDRIKTVTDLITIFQNCVSLHSLHFEKNWKWKLNDPFTKDKLFVIHIGEGTDAFAKKEIDVFNKYNFFKRKTIAVHGVAMDEKQAEGFTALTWCPATNYNLLGRTTDISTLKNKTTILFGTDSTLTADWNTWRQLRVARDSKQVSDEELFDMLTKNPADVWRLNAGSFKPKAAADIVVAKRKAGNFFDLDPEDILMVIRQGEIKLFDEVLLQQVNDLGIDTANFSKIIVNAACKYVKGDLSGLMKQVKEYYPAVVFPIQAGN